MPTKKAFLLFLFSIFFSFTATGQAERGFAYLKQNEPEKAEQAFRNSLAHPTDGVAARFGMAWCYLQQDHSFRQLCEGLAFLRESRRRFPALDANTKARYQPYGLSPAAYPDMEKALQAAALHRVNNSRSVAQLDSLLQLMSPFPEDLEKEVQNTRRAVVQHAAHYAEDYASIRSLAENHYGLVIQANYRYPSQLEEKLLNSFVKENGLYALSEFKESHPGHPFSRDCWVDQFISAINSKALRPLLHFLSDYPHSTLDVLADVVLRAKTGNGANIPQAHLLTAAEKQQLESCKAGWKLQAALESKEPFGPALQQELLSHIQKSAPASRTYFLMKKALQAYLDNRQWEPATALVKFSQPLFPDVRPKGCGARFSYFVEKQLWFRVAIPIIERAADGIYRMPLAALNTPEGSEYSPAVSADGSELYFAATGREGQVGGEDIFLSRYDFRNKSWGPPQLAESLSTAADEVPLSMTSDGNHLLLFRNGQLHLAALGREGWEKPQPLPDNINAFPWLGRATLSSDGQVIIFAAIKDLQKVYSESDIDLYFSRKGPSGQWAPPQPLGPDVNTFEQERSPFLFHDNETLYFSSNGHKGLGGMDVFYSKRLDDSWQYWSVPQNLGKEVNTLDDDWGFQYSMSPAGNTVYLSAEDLYSNLGDLFFTGLPKHATPAPIAVYRGRLMNPSGEGLQSPLLVTDLESGEVIEEVMPRPDGSVSILARGGKKLSVYPKDQSLFPVSRIIDPSTTTPGTVDTIHTVPIALMLEEGVSAPLNNILFDFDKAVLKPRSIPELLRVYELVKDERWLIRIEGHTDNVGAAAYNQKLSEQRAAAVLQFLAGQGISPSRMSAEGFGDTQPLASNADEAGRAKNRRVVIRFERK